MFIKLAYLLAVFHILLSWLLAWRRGVRARSNEMPPPRLQGRPFVSVLIPAWNERSTLASTLHALRQSDYPEREVIIIAGGPDGTYEYARQLCAAWPEVTVIEQPPRGKNAALNLGWQRARGDILVLLDADTLVAPDWLSFLIAPLTQGCEATTANYFPYRQTWTSALFEMEKIASYFSRRAVTLQGCSIALKRQVVENLGGFPEEVTVGVDWDLNCRLQTMGVRRCFVPQALVHTPLPETLVAYVRNQIRWRRAHLQSILRHFSRSSASGLLFYGVALLFFAALLSLLVRPTLWPAVLLFWLWLFLRRLGLGIECAACSGRAVWLRYSGALLVLLLVDFAAAVLALCTLRRRIVFFRGTRSPAVGTEEARKWNH